MHSTEVLIYIKLKFLFCSENKWTLIKPIKSVDGIYWIGIYLFDTLLII